MTTASQRPQIRGKSSANIESLIRFGDTSLQMRVDNAIGPDQSSSLALLHRRPSSIHINH